MVGGFFHDSSKSWLFQDGPVQKLTGVDYYEEGYKYHCIY